MPIRREFPPRSLNAEALNEGRVDSHYTKVLLRLLAAHAMAEKLTALGYQRALETLDNPDAASDRREKFRRGKKTRAAHLSRARRPRHEPAGARTAR